MKKDSASLARAFIFAFALLAYDCYRINTGQESSFDYFCMGLVVAFLAVLVFLAISSARIARNDTVTCPICQHQFAWSDTLGDVRAHTLGAHHKQDS